MVTTALCADQAAVAVAPPLARPQAADLVRAAEGFASRLASGLRRAADNLRAPFACACPAKPQAATGRVIVRRPEEPDAVYAVRPPISPFQFRLPPPLA